MKSQPSRKPTVKKGVNRALSGIGKRRSQEFCRLARTLGSRLAASNVATSRWIGRDALRDLK